MSRITSSLLIVGALALAACNDKTPPAAPSGTAPAAAPAAKPTAAAAAALSPRDSITPEVRELFKTRCAVCHGETGKGDGPGAAALNPKPRNYTDKEWQAKVSDEDIRKVIHYGGAAVGKSLMMPANPDLEAKPAIVNGLIGVIREFASK